MSSAQARRDEILAKKAKLAERKRQREQRQKDLQHSRQSLDAAGQLSLADSVSHSPSGISRATKSAPKACHYTTLTYVHNSPYSNTWDKLNFPHLLRWNC